MFFTSRIIVSSNLIQISRIRFWFRCYSSASTWEEDIKLGEAIHKDRKWRICIKIVDEVLNSPGQTIPIHYLDKRRKRMCLNPSIQTFLDSHPGLFDTYLNRIRPKSEPVPFLRPSEKLLNFLEEKKRINLENEHRIVEKLCKFLLMSKNKVLSVDKLVHVKREFGFPNDFMENLVPKYPKYFRLAGRKSFLELVLWEPEFAKSVIEKRAEKESRFTGIKVRPSFNVKKPSFNNTDVKVRVPFFTFPEGFFLKKEMGEWTRDSPYISPYEDISSLEQSSTEMEERTISVLHELLSMSLYKRVPVLSLLRFSTNFRFSSEFMSVFTCNCKIFHLSSSKGGIETAVLREAYNGHELVDKDDPFLQIKDKFCELLADERRGKRLRLKKGIVSEHIELMAMMNKSGFRKGDKIIDDDVDDGYDEQKWF